eukprot:CAMPEP_0170490976 /NCGR_PEP_ID=MMETSP0208-20121228/10133_1 /TAXON_ID=197538 /ORGANISM="Strombidium inclinatum, Strain S3" /LENGTH=90 /DNA_ID=CAMNT_0010766471 /DNA_START=231 /DNA_END=503 /DNA_ORIENTATION=-
MVRTEGDQVVEVLLQTTLVDSTEVDVVNIAWDLVDAVPGFMDDNLGEPVADDLSLLSEALRLNFQRVLLVEAPLDPLNNSSDASEDNIDL